MNVLEINKTGKAKKKLAAIAKRNNLDYEFIYYLFSFYWNYDGIEGDWVDTKKLDIDSEYKKRYELLYDKLNLSNKILTKNEVVEKIYNGLSEIDIELLKNRFLHGSQNGNYGFISEYASYYYLNNATIEKLETLEWAKGKYTKEIIVSKMFYKIFRGGSVDRYNLEYLYADLIVKLNYNIKNLVANDWIKDFIEKPKAKTLTELTKELRHYCKGDKYFLQTILEALSYSGELKIKSHDVNKIFIPDYRNELSKHFYLNEWTYPLRFWNE